MTDNSREDLFGSLAVRAGLVSEAQLMECLDFQALERKAGRLVPKLGEVLAAKGYLKAGQVEAILDGKVEPAAPKAVPAASAPAERLPPLPEAPEAKPHDTKGVAAVAAAPQRSGAATFAGYEVLARLGTNASGGLYLARKASGEPAVTLKIFSPERSRAEGFIEQFTAAIKAGAGLRHPGVNRILDAGRDRGRVFCASEYVEGQSLRHLLETHQQLEVAQALRIARRIAEVLRYAYEQGVLHGEIKPSNVIIQLDGRIKLANFGVVSNPIENLLVAAREAGQAPVYAAPELAVRRATATVRSEIYSLGATLYHMLTGRPPYQGENPLQALMRMAREEPPAPGALRKGLPAEVERAVLSMMAVEASARPADFGAALALLDAAGAAIGLASAASGEEPAPEVFADAAAAARRRKILGALVVLSIFLVFVLAALVLVIMAPVTPRLPAPVPLAAPAAPAAPGDKPAAKPADEIPAKKKT